MLIRLLQLLTGPFHIVVFRKSAGTFVLFVNTYPMIEGYLVDWLYLEMYV